MRAKLAIAIAAVLAFGTLAAFADGPRSRAALPDSSLYHLDSKWQRDDGTRSELVDLRGGVKVISMFFTGCDNLCPMLLGQLKSLERALPAGIKDEVGFVLVSMDSKDDTPIALRRYRKESDLSPERWTLLRGSADDTRELAALLGVKYTPKQDDGQMGHTGLIAILDRDGAVLAKTASLGSKDDIKNYVARLTRAVAAGR